MKGKASGGGVKSARDVHAYREPSGRCESTRGPGLGGRNLGKSGTQGATSIRTDGQSGRPGLGGENLRKGVNRHG